MPATAKKKPAAPKSPAAKRGPGRPRKVQPGDEPGLSNRQRATLKAFAKKRAAEKKKAAAKPLIELSPAALKDKCDAAGRELARKAAEPKFEQVAFRLVTGLLPAHPLADRLPAMTDAEYEALKASIEANGQIDTVLLLDGKVLDGRHRNRANVDLGRPTRVEDFDPKRHGDPVEYVIAKSSHRNLTDEQKACAAANFMDDLQGRVGRPSNNSCQPAGISGESSEIAAARFGVSGRQVARVWAIRKRSRELFDQVFAGRINIHRALHQAEKADREKEVKAEAGKPCADFKLCTLEEGDCVERLARIGTRTVRVVFTDPPYNIGKDYHNDRHGDAREDGDFIAWCESWLRECVRILADDGSLFVMINGEYAARLEVVLRRLGLHRRNTIYWWENNPENQTGNFSDAVRQILYFTKMPSGFVFNDDVRVDSRRQIIGDKRGLDSGKLPDNVWIEGRIPGNSLDRVPFEDAPPQLPVSIPETAIRVASNPGDLVVDPFNGNGTTGIAAALHGRRYLGIDQSDKYLAQAAQWMKAQLRKLRKGAEEGAES